MEKARSDLKYNPFGSTPSAESSLDLERNYCRHPTRSPSPLQANASGGQFTESSAAYFSWPTTSRLNDAAQERSNYFGNIQKGVLPETYGQLPTGQRATTLLEVMTVRAFHSKILRRCSLGTAVGFRIRGGCLTNIPAILVFVARKVNRQWLNQNQCLPTALEGPGGVWCDVDVVEFSYFGAPAATPKEEFYTELVDGLRGSDPYLGSGSQVASQVTYGTLSAIVKSRTGNRQVGFLTNRHVAVDLDYPNQKMFHPLPPSLGPGVYLGAVERATSFITDDLWYDIFAGTNPETFVRADGAFIAFAEDLNISNVSTSVKGIGEIGEVNIIDLQSSINSLIGRQVMKVGRSSGLTTGTIMAYALEYNDEKGICFFTDFLVVGEKQQTFDLEGDSGSLILLAGQNSEKPRPVGIIWGGTANRGRLKLKVGQPPENWTSGVDLGRLLDLLELDLITTEEGLLASVREQRNASIAGMDSAFGESSPYERKQYKEYTEKVSEPLELIPTGGACHCRITPQFMHKEFHIEGGSKLAPNVEFQFIPSMAGISTMHQNNKQENADSESLPGSRRREEISISLQLGEPGQKRKKQSDYLLVSEDLN